MTEKEAIKEVKRWTSILLSAGAKCVSETAEAQDMAIKALEKQAEKKVIDNMPTDDDVWYQCPTCKGDLTHIRGIHCPYCGQKLDWSDEDDN